MLHEQADAISPTAYWLLRRLLDRLMFFQIIRNLLAFDEFMDLCFNFGIELEEDVSAHCQITTPSQPVVYNRTKLDEAMSPDQLLCIFLL